MVIDLDECTFLHIFAQAGFEKPCRLWLMAGIRVSQICNYILHMFLFMYYLAYTMYIHKIGTLCGRLCF